MMKNVSLLMLFAVLLSPPRAVPGLQAGQEAAFTAVEGAFFALSVRDIEASARWYSEKFGLTVRAKIFGWRWVSGFALSKRPRRRVDCLSEFRRHARSVRSEEPRSTTRHRQSPGSASGISIVRSQS
jgi:hypothetical protein